MILADKIVAMRKKSGWSQEELAEKMEVSRQAVSKWESAQTVPDLNKILQLGKLFGVTTDYLLKDELELEECSGVDSALRRVTLKEANEFLTQRERASVRIALATFLCILSPICLLILGVMTLLSIAGKYCHRFRNDCIADSGSGGSGNIYLYRFSKCSL